MSKEETIRDLAQYVAKGQVSLPSALRQAYDKGLAAAPQPEPAKPALPSASGLADAMGRAFGRTDDGLYGLLAQVWQRLGRNQQRVTARYVLEELEELETEEALQQEPDHRATRGGLSGGSCRS
jgi:hypothetical protein